MRVKKFAVIRYVILLLAVCIVCIPFAATVMGGF